MLFYSLVYFCYVLEVIFLRFWFVVESCIECPSEVGLSPDDGETAVVEAR